MKKLLDILSEQFAKVLAECGYDEKYGHIINDSLSLVESKVEQLLKNQIINNTQTNLVYLYVLNGYDVLEDEDKEKIKEINLSSIGITNNEDYKGIINKDAISMSEYISTKPIDYTLGTTSINLEIEESILNSIITNNDIIGSSYAFGHDESNEKYSHQVSYIVIEDLIMDLKENNIELDFIINVHGYRIGIHANFIANEHSGLIIEGKLTNLLLGSIELNEKQQIDVLKYLDTVIKEEWLSISSESEIITLNFSNFVSSNPIIQTFMNLGANTLITTSINENNINIKFGL